MPMKIQPTETAAMIYYVMGLHSQLFLLLLEINSSSLSRLFEDALEVEENIYASRRIWEHIDFENLHLLEPTECQYSSDFEQEGNNYEADSEQQQAGDFILNYKSDSSVFADGSMDKYACKVYDQFENQVEPMIIDDGIKKSIFYVDPYSYDSNITLSSSSEYFSEEKFIMIDDQDLILKEQKYDQSSGRETIINDQDFCIDQHVSDLCFKDPMAAFMECYISKNLKILDFLNSSPFRGKYGFVNELLSLLLQFKHQLLISEKDNIILVLKLLGSLLWKSAFT